MNPSCLRTGYIPAVPPR